MKEIAFIKSINIPTFTFFHTLAQFIAKVSKSVIDKVNSSSFLAAIGPCIPRWQECYTLSHSIHFPLFNDTN